MDNLEVGGEVPLRSEPGRAVEAEVDILVLLAAVQRQVPATDEQCCGTGTGQKVGTGTVNNYGTGTVNNYGSRTVIKWNHKVFTDTVDLPYFI